MRLLDANLLIYSVNQDSELHEPVLHWLKDAFKGEESIGFSWLVILAFVRVSTRPGLFRSPLDPEAALDLVEAWLDHPLAKVIDPGPSHLTIMRHLVSALGTGGNLTSDIHLAALAIENRAELCSSDSDFSRFPGLRWHNPLARGRFGLPKLN
jgi:toxin-antitoxin system PIN domain toxin